MQERLWAVVGPTASGKTAVSMALAQATRAEVIACDSVQVYQGFDIGSAKPSLEEQKLCPHHVIDVVAWHQPFDASVYQTHALAALKGLYARGLNAVLCGGTGLYLRALRYGLLPHAASDTQVREHLMAMENAEPGSAYRMLQEKDPASARATHPSNKVHVLRALEMCVITGAQASQLKAQHGFQQEQCPMVVFHLVWDAETLKKRIHTRTHALLKNGLLDEAECLLKQGVPPTAKPMASVGYKEACAVLQGQLPAKDLHETLCANTWQYARRQRTWFKKEKNTVDVPMRDENEACLKIMEHLKKGF